MFFITFLEGQEAGESMLFLKEALRDSGFGKWEAGPEWSRWTEILVLGFPVGTLLCEPSENIPTSIAAEGSGHRPSSRLALP